MLKAIKRGLTTIANHTGFGKRILKGIKTAKVDMQFTFQGLPSENAKMMDLFVSSFGKKAPKALNNILNDSEFLSILKKYAKKNNFLKDLPKNLSTEEIMGLMLQKGGVGPSKFAQIISSDTEIMSKFSPKLQAIIKNTQSQNPFSRTLKDAQDIVNRAFSSKQKLIGTIKPEIELVKALSAGTVGEAYLAKTSKGEMIVKMIKNNVDARSLALEEQIYSRFIQEFAPNEGFAQKQIKMLHNLYKDWSKELNFSHEFKYNKLLQKGAKRFKVADITRMSKDGSCILMEKAEGIQMNNLLKMLQDYKSKPNEFFIKYAKEIEQNKWLREPEKVIADLPKSITLAFDEQFIFMKKGGASIMHGDPHMGNYFITRENGVLKPIFIDTGNCVIRNKKQIAEDLSFFLCKLFSWKFKRSGKIFCKTVQQP